jgi:DNA repair protein REV1
MDIANDSLHPSDATGKADSQPSRTSSFPISSPTFWSEAANLADTIKRSRSPSPLQEISIDSSPRIPPPVKRARFDADTSLSYLPNRLDPLLDETNPHSYLAAAEYAPNKFGDIGDYMRKKEIKVQTQNRDIALASALEGIPQIFVGQSFYINGNTHPPMEELRKMILQRGGEVRPVLRNKGMVKYIIAPMLTQSKFKQFERYKVVREGWILESCKQGKMLDWSRWKLQPQGGWQEEGRKGLEGFLAGQSQVTKEEMEVEPAAEDEGRDDHKASLPTAIGTQSLIRPPAATAARRSLLQAPMSSARPITRSARPSSNLPPPAAAPTPAPILHTTPVSAVTSPQNINPVSIIPISPGAATTDSSKTDEVPPKVQRPEGGWEFYHSKESNTEAARLLKNQDWRLKNTAERGNEGGFIDGYYQNSRYVTTTFTRLRLGSRSVCTTCPLGKQSFEC